MIPQPSHQQGNQQPIDLTKERRFVEKMIGNEQKCMKSTTANHFHRLTASMATRPWVNSASRYRLRVASSAFSANPRGSKSPTGARAPGISSTEKLNEVDFLVEEAGAKAAADPARARRAAANFILLL